jgi:ABC-type bacteriocin/lantibiotic exporter with double-glycine peptidase domain
VLIIGLVAIAIFETVLGILRTYLFAHTTNRIDVRHAIRLPLLSQWFERITAQLDISTISLFHMAG